MSFAATILSVMIASPGDVPEARAAVYAALARWNESHARSRGVVLMPRRWETGVVPELGDHPQGIINKQLLHDADIVIALFGSRIGTETPNAISGSVEEISQAAGAGKPVHIWFSNAPHPNDVDLEQLQALRKFKEELQQRGLYGQFGSIEELTANIWQAIEHDIATLGVGAPNTRPAPKEVIIRVQAGRESVPETDGRGRLKSKTNHWIDVRNDGDVDAEQVRVESNSDSLHIVGSERPRTLSAKQSQRIPYFLSFGDDDSSITVHWVEGGEEKSKTFDI